MKVKTSEHLWIIDPWNTLDHPCDSTLRFMEAGMEEAAKLGVSQYGCDVKSIRLVDTPQGPRVALDAKKLISVRPDRTANSFEWGPVEMRSPRDFKNLYYRTDPPVDLAYLHPLQLLGLEVGYSKKNQWVNPLEVLLLQNEKMEASCLGNLMAPSLVSSQWEYLLPFGRKLGRTVLKPLHEAQSHGIELLDWRTPEGVENAKGKLASATQQFQTPVILQIFLEAIAEGETRLWFLDGKLLAHVKKVPAIGDFRVNMDQRGPQGSRLALSTLTENEKKTVKQISRHLRTRKIRLAAVDLIENFITDFNFTSPGLIPLMESLLEVNLAKPIVRALFSS